MGQERSIHDALAELAARIDTATESRRDEARRVEELRLAVTHLELAMLGATLEGPGEAAARVALWAHCEIDAMLRVLADEVRS